MNTPGPSDRPPPGRGSPARVAPGRIAPRTVRAPAVEQRARPRYPVRIAAHITTPEHPGRPCTIRDFSASGMFISCESDTFELLPAEDEQLRAGAAVEIRFQMPGQAARVKVRARVTRVVRSVFEDRLGVFFATCNEVILRALIRESETAPAGRRNPGRA